MGFNFLLVIKCAFRSIYLIIVKNWRLLKRWVEKKMEEKPVPVIKIDNKVKIEAA